MKIYFTIFLFLFTSFYGFSQISFQQGDYATVGESFVVSTSNLNLGGLDFTQTGTNFNWDYSTVIPSTQEVTTFIDPDNAGYETSWIANCIFNTGGIFTCPGAWNDLTNLATKNDDNTSFLNLLPIGISDVVTHFDRNNDLLRETMLGISIGTGGFSLPVPIDYDIPDTVYRFPIDYLDIDSSERAFSIDLSGFGADFIYSSAQKRINSVEGWGSLTTPFDTYSSTLKMKTIIYHNDSTTVAGNTLPTNITTEVIYSWFEKNTGIPVLVAKGLIVGGFDVITSVNFVDSVRCFTPNATFLTNPLLVIVDPVSGNADVNFANLSQNADTYKWSFGDGDSSTQVNPSHTYSGGLYNVNLIACNSVCIPARCDTFEFPLLVIDSSAVVANWTASSNTPCEGDTISFNNFSFNADTYLWDFGDGNTSTQEAPQHAFQTSGDYTVRLIATSGAQVDTSERIISVNNFPIAFAGNDTAIGTGQSLQLIASGGGAGANYIWDFNSSLSCVFCDNPVATPSETTTYIVRARNSCGTDMDTITVTIDSTISRISQNIFEKGNWNIYPNPFTESLTIDYDGKVKNLTINLYTLTGKEIKKWRMDKNIEELDVTGLPQGFYIMKITQDSEVIGFMKLVKR